MRTCFKKAGFSSFNQNSLSIMEDRMTGLSRIWLTCKKGFALGFIFSAYPTRKLLGDLKLLFHRNLKVPKAFFSHLHKVLWMFFCCFFLAACSGGSDSGSSSSNSGSNVPEGDAEEEECSIENGVAEQRGDKCVVVSCDEGYYKPTEGDNCLEGGNKRHRPCVIANGEGELTWSPQKGAWNDECQLIACNAGYDDADSDNDCEETIAEYYSTAGSKSRAPCTGKPDDSSWTVATGLANANECKWTCNASYDDHDDDGTCSVTDAGHYSPDGNSDRISCSTVTAPDDATADSASASTGLSSANQCWTCNAGYDDHNDDGTCSVTDAGHYSPDGNSDRISCNTVTAPDDATADSASASTGLSSANQCWTCNAGYDDHNDDGTCSVTDAGHYSPDGNSDRISCNTVTAPDDATADSASASTGLSSANQCWTCNAGYDDHDDDGTCSVTAAGHYSPDGNSDRISCNTVTAPDDATADSASASTGLSSANQCGGLAMRAMTTTMTMGLAV